MPVEEAPRFVERRVSWAETWKDRWNGEVEGAVKWAQGLRWNEIREGLEGRWIDRREKTE